MGQAGMGQHMWMLSAEQIKETYQVNRVIHIVTLMDQDILLT